VTSAVTDHDTSDVDALADVVENACQSLGGIDAARGLIDGGHYDAQLWRTLGVDIGVCAIGVPESFGGLGGLAELVAAAEKIGRELTPVPFVSQVLTAQVLSRCGEPARSLIDRLLNGEIGVLCTGEDFSVRGNTISGATTATLAGADAAQLLVHCAGHLHIVKRDSSAVGVRIPDSLDATRRWALFTLHDAPMQRICPLDDDAVERSRDVAELALSAEALGGAQRCLDMTVAYVKERYQFGRPIGSFQAIKHTLADLLVGVEMTRSAVERAAGVAPDDPAFEEAVSVARLWSAEAYRQVTAETVHLHGGNGFTWEHPAHLYFRRARSDMAMFGGLSRHRSRLQRLLGLASPVDVGSAGVS
jgi:alkylation response protein AidB-like acyl-CoA dehydrogenase